MKFKLIDASGRYYCDVVIEEIDDLKSLQFYNESNPKNDKLIIDFKHMSIMIYNDYIE